jgi:DNA modification methylase
MGFEIKTGDVLSRIAEIEDGTVNTCVTSPPYWGLRDYNNDGQIGLEEDPNEYIDKMVKVFREVKRVLRDDGTLWLNIGDSYSGSGKGPAGNLGKKHNERHLEKKTGGLVPKGTKPKDLVGIPWMLAFALRADGWYLRQDIIWAKPNPMPESVKDRCTKSHEYVFLLSKSSKYYFDSEAMKEDGVIPAGTKGAKGSIERQGIKGVNARPPVYKVYDGKRNKRDVWFVKTKPFPGAHFAVMPEELVEPCILAGSPKGGLVLDPFTGSGTVGVVSLRNERNFVGIELNPEYAMMAKERIGVENYGGFAYLSSRL